MTMIRSVRLFASMAVAVAGGALTVPSSGVSIAPAKAASTATRSASSVSCETFDSSWVDKDGDSWFKYSSTTTATVHVRVAPDFNALKATPERLAKLGIPSPPELGSNDYAEWLDIVKAISSQTATGPSCAGKAKAAPPLINWAGYQATAASGKRYSNVHSSYTAPTIYDSQCTDESLTSWVGYGQNNNYFVQAGIYRSQYGGTLNESGFWEIVGGTLDTGTTQDLYGSHFKMGHRYYLYIGYRDSNTLNVQLLDLDEPTNKFNGFVVTGSAGGVGNYLGPRGLFIDERLLYGTTYSQFADHSDTRYRTATVHIYGETDARMTIQSPDSIFMESGGLLLGNPASLDTTNSNFSGVWDHC